MQLSLEIGERRSLGQGGSVQEIRQPAGTAAFGECTLPPALAAILARRGIERLYAHQAETIEAVRAGRSVILCAPTASGKTEAFLVPAVEAALAGRRTLLLFPTKALSRDQLARFAELEPLGLRAAVYDGDTPEAGVPVDEERVPALARVRGDGLGRGEGEAVRLADDEGVERVARVRAGVAGVGTSTAGRSSGLSLGPHVRLRRLSRRERGLPRGVRAARGGPCEGARSPHELRLRARVSGVHPRPAVNANEHLDKAAGREILERLLGAGRELPGLDPSPPGPG